MPAEYGPLTLPTAAWHREDTRAALHRRDVAALFRLAQQYAGASQARIAAATGIQQGRVNEILNGKRDVARLDVFERIADGLGMPDDARQLLGLAPSYARKGGADPESLAEVTRVFRRQSDAAAEIQVLASTASRVDVLAVRGLGLLGLNHSLLRSRVMASEQATAIRVLLIDPASPAAEQRAAELGESMETFVSGIHLSASRLRELAGEIGVSVEVYYYRVVPVWRLIVLDDTAYVAAFDQATEGHESVMYRVVATPHGVLYRGFRRAFESLRRDSERIM